MTRRQTNQKTTEAEEHPDADPTTGDPARQDFEQDGRTFTRYTQWLTIEGMKGDEKEAIKFATDKLKEAAKDNGHTLSDIHVERIADGRAAVIGTTST